MFRVFIKLIPLLFFLAACQSTPKPDLAAQRAIQTFHFTGIELKKSSDFDQGFHLAGKENAQGLAASFTEETKAKLASVFSQRLQGAQPAKVTVLFENISVASGVGRAIAASDSTVKGTVSIHNATTGEIVASKTIVSKDEAYRGGGNIGVLVSVVANAANSSRVKRVAALRDKFVGDVDAWLATAVGQ